MEEIRRVYWDTNIFINLVQGKDVVRGKLEQLLSRIRRREQTFIVTSELTYAETIVFPYREKNERLMALYENWSYSNAVLEVRPVTRRVLHQAAVLRAEYKSLKLPDAIHIATAIDADCTHVLSGDLGLSGEYKLFLGRYGWSAGSRAVEVVRPTVEIVDRLIEASS